MASVSLPKIAVHPSLTTTVDQKVDITVTKLSPEQHITLRARTIDDSKIVFESFAHYKADKNGEVLVSSQPSMGGSYTGLEPMGLFWSMKPPFPEFYCLGNSLSHPKICPQRDQRQLSR